MTKGFKNLRPWGETPGRTQASDSTHTWGQVLAAPGTRPHTEPHATGAVVTIPGARTQSGCQPRCQIRVPEPLLLEISDQTNGGISHQRNSTTFPSSASQEDLPPLHSRETKSAEGATPQRDTRQTPWPRRGRLRRPQCREHRRIGGWAVALPGWDHRLRGGPQASLPGSQAAGARDKELSDLVTPRQTSFLIIFWR